MNSTASRNNAAAITARLHSAGHEAYFVGGCVRDIVRGEEPADYDIVTSALPSQVQTLFSKTYPVGAAFGVILVVEGEHPYEVATYRTESNYEDGRHPSHVAYATAEQDVLRRDFTINGLLMEPESGGIIDYVGGVADIENRLVRTIGDPDERFTEDHLRMIRAVRFSANLGYTIHPDTYSAIVRKAPLVRKISSERIRDEMNKILTSVGARCGLEVLSESGLLKEILPELSALRGIEQPAAYHPEGDVWEHTLRMIDLLSRSGRPDARLAWAVVLHDIGKAVSRSEDTSGVHFYGHVQQGMEIAAAILERYRFSRNDQETILTLIREHMKFMHVRNMRPSRIKRFIRMADFDLHMELHRLDCLGSHGMLDNYEYCREKMAEFTHEELHPLRLITGHDLIAMGFVPGPHFKEILGELEEAQLSGSIASAEDARTLVMNRYGHLTSKRAGK
jgi:poly(A) polymerase